MDVSSVSIAALAALVAVLAFLGLLASLSARAGQESRLKDFLRSREGFVERLLQLRKRRVERLRAFRERVGAGMAGRPGEKPAAGAAAGPEHARPDPPGAAHPALAAIARETKEDPAKAASILKTLIQPRNGA